MRKMVFGRRFKKDTNQRKALFKSLMSSLILHERIKTTEAKAKAIKGELEKYVTKAKKADKSRYFLSQKFDKKIVDKLILDIAPRFSTRPGGYTRILKYGKRLKDNADMVLIEWVEGPKGLVVQKSNAKNDKKKDNKKTKFESAIKADKKEKKNVKKDKDEKTNKTNKKK